MTDGYVVPVLTQLARFAGSPRVRAGLLAVVLAFCAYGLYAEWPHVTSELARLHWYSTVLSLAAALAGSFCLMLGWRAVLADLGSVLPVRVSARINFVAQLGKYVPGAVWAFAAQVELGHDYRVPRGRSLASVVVSLAITVGSGLGVAAIALPLASPATASRYWWALGAVVVLAIGLCPPVLGRVLTNVLRLARMAPLERQPTWRGLAVALGFDVAGWLLLGTQVWLLLHNAASRPGAQLLPLAVGGYALAFSAGLLLVVIPSGIGAREIILIATLAPAVGHATALAIALATRVITTASDLTCGAVGLAARRRDRKIAAAVHQAGRDVSAARAPAASGRHRKPHAVDRPARARPGGVRPGRSAGRIDAS